MHSTLSLRSFPSVALETVPMFVWLTFPMFVWLPLSSFQGRLLSVSSFHASRLQVIDGVMSLALCLLVVSQTPQHFRSSQIQTTCDGCFFHQSISSLISLHSKKKDRTDYLWAELPEHSLAQLVSCQLHCHMFKPSFSTCSFFCNRLSNNCVHSRIWFIHLHFPPSPLQTWKLLQTFDSKQTFTKWFNGKVGVFSCLKKTTFSAWNVGHGC